ncbi:hypothetical protein BaRGS_00003892 [Batillaria attramentaria]|uniref:Nudix hydrolase domain-containing protein n=1 Tax=Batillaria attramentaria TaxID=370345 RepID=A0ABD0M0N4_9CAEN
MDPDIEIMFVADVEKLIPESKTSVSVLQKFNRMNLPDDKSSIEEIWANRLKENPRLFNGTKFRLHSVSSDSTGHLTLNLGVTDYREYLGTNWAPDVNRFHEQGLQLHSDPQVFLSDPAGVGAFTVTSDEYVIFLRRSSHCAEAPGMWDIPGGHAEPEEIVGKAGMDEIDYSLMTSGAVSHEIFHSILREVRDEVNIGEQHLSPALLMGIARNITSAGRPSIEFLVRCSLSRDEVLALYRQGSQAEADESTSIMLLPVSTVVTLQTQDPALWSTIAPSAKGCVILYKMCHGM